MLKWSVNNIPELVTKELVEGIGTALGEGEGIQKMMDGMGKVCGEGESLRRKQEQVFRREKSGKWKKVKCVMKFCKLGAKKQVKTNQDF